MGIKHLDIKTTFPNGDLEEEVYMFKPQGFTILGIEHLVCNFLD
jgi:hypothetical protein